MQVLPASRLFYCGKRFRSRQEKRGKKSLERAESKVWEWKGPDSAACRLEIQHWSLLPFKPPLGWHGEGWSLTGDEASVEPGGGCLTEKGCEGRRKLLTLGQEIKDWWGWQVSKEILSKSDQEFFEKPFFFLPKNADLSKQKIIPKPTHSYEFL